MFEQDVVSAHVQQCNVDHHVHAVYIINTLELYYDLLAARSAVLIR